MPPAPVPAPAPAPVDPPAPVAPDFSKMTAKEIAALNPAIADILKKQQEADELAAKQAREKAEAEGKHAEIIKQQDTTIKELQKKIKDRDEIVEKYTGTVNDILGNLLTQVPEEKKSIIPDSLSPRHKLEYVLKNAKWLGISASGGADGGVPPSDKPVVTDEQKIIEEIEGFRKKVQDGTITASEQEIYYEKAKKLKELRNARGAK